MDKMLNTFKMTEASLELNYTTPEPAYNTTDALSLSPELELHLLQYASDRKALLYIPVIVFIGILMLIGVFGNVLVVYIYLFRFPNRSSNCFFVTMAIFDLLASAIAIPIEIYDIRNHYTFHNIVICKIFRCVEGISTYGSAIVLVEIAFDRYLKICKPLKFGTKKRCKIMCLSALIIASVMSVPSLFLFGITHETVNIKGFNVTGNDCSVADEYKGTIFQKTFYGVLVFIFICTFCLLAGFYIRIWIEIKRRKGITIGDRLRNDENKAVRPIYQKQRSFPSESEDETSSVFQQKPERILSASQTPKTRPVSRAHSNRWKMTSLSNAVSNMKVSRTTKIFIAVTLVFVLSYLPSIAVMLSRTLIRRLNTSQTVVEDLFLKLFSRFHYLNNSLNPIIYSFLNINFRRQCSKLFQSIVFCCKLSSSDRKSTSGSTISRRKCSLNRNSDSSKSDVTHPIKMHNLKR